VAVSDNRRMSGRAASNTLDGETNSVPALDGCVSVSRVFDGARLEVVHWRCLREIPPRRGERAHRWAVLSLTDAGASVVHDAHGRTVVEPASAVLREAGAPYRTTHPFGCGDEGCNVALAPELISEIGGWPVRQAVVPAAPRLELFVAVRRLRRGLRVPPLAIEEAALAVVASVLGGARGGGRDGHHAGRERTRDGHRAVVDAVRTYFAGNLGQHITLADVAAAAAVSPFHLARTFRRATGIPLHRYLTRMRLLSALPRASARRGSLTDLALDLGFSSHSHLTSAFRREFGVPPSEVRRRSTACSFPP
jgi:AraC family transcriptional regulator